MSEINQNVTQRARKLARQDFPNDTAAAQNMHFYMDKAEKQLVDDSLDSVRDPYARDLIKYLIEKLDELKK